VNTVFLRESIVYSELVASDLLEQVLFIFVLSLQEQNRVRLLNIGAHQSVLQVVKFAGVRNIDAESKDSNVRDHVLLCLFFALKTIEELLTMRGELDYSAELPSLGPLLGENFRATAFSTLCGTFFRVHPKD
jgi:hypothetical protein